jgi:preprotein translocase subunit SecE
MKKRTMFVVLVVLAVAAAIWFGGEYLWSWLLAMHGRHQ